MKILLIKKKKNYDGLKSRVDNIISALKKLKEENEELKRNKGSGSSVSISSSSNNDQQIQSLNSQISRLEQKDRDSAREIERLKRDLEDAQSKASSNFGGSGVSVVITPPMMSGGPPPPPMMSGGPPPPPPPNLGGPPPPPPNLGGGGPKIGNRGNDRGALLSQIQGGVSLKKTDGPKEPKLNTTSSSGGGGGGSKPQSDPFSIGALASELAKQRALRVQQKALQGNSYRKSMKLDNLLEELK